MRLDKVLAHRGFGSRKAVKLLIRKGWVRVNDDLVFDDDMHINLETDELQVFDQSIELIESNTFIHHKKQGVICSHTSQLYATIYEEVPFQLLPHTHSIGRLDVDTEGLILLTNDGQLSHRLLSPKYHVEKMYQVRLEKPFDLKFLKAIETGLMLETGERCLSAKIEIIEASLIHLTLVEGKYHQVKRMMKMCENEVVHLKRLTFGPLNLDDLALGDTRSLSDEELKLLKKP